MTGCAAFARLCIGRMATSRTDVSTVITPMKRSPPNPLSVALQTAWTTPLEAWKTKPNMPRFMVERMMRPSGRTEAGVRRMMARLPAKNRSAQAAEAAWETTLPRAAPATPHPATKMRIGSSAMFITAPSMTVAMPKREKPCALMKPFIPAASITNGVPIK